MYCSRTIYRTCLLCVYRDENGDGVINREEFHTAMPLLGLHVAREHVDKLFDLFDPDRSGEIEYREFNAQLRKMLCNL